MLDYTQPDFTVLPIKELQHSLRQGQQNQDLPYLLPWPNTEIATIKHLWRQISHKQEDSRRQILVNRLCNKDKDEDETQAVDALISIFNRTFIAQNVRLQRGLDEPEYFIATSTMPARIEFAHGFFASALHEISHWCIAGSYRRTLPDYGYWYTPDGRTAEQQAHFEQVEIKPQAIECLLTLSCHRPFRVSQDNLAAGFDTSGSTFAHDVYKQAAQYIAMPDSLPKDARILLTVLAIFSQF